MTDAPPPDGGQESAGLDAATMAREVHRTWSLQSALVPLYSVFLALVVASVIILLVGGNPLEAYAALLDGMFGTPDRINLKGKLARFGLRRAGRAVGRRLTHPL